MKSSVTLYVDADACPVKDEVQRVALRAALRTIFVGNSRLRLPDDPLFESVVVATEPDAADDWIAARVGLGSVVVTADIPLADRCVKAGARVVTPKGRVLDAGSIGAALATRDLLDDLRSAGATTAGPAPFTPRDRQAFLQALDREVRRAAHDLAGTGRRPIPIRPIRPSR
ncbi:MAG: YaiI/YqxD family protein [Phyllobacteriaceae bacterium]|nr:YaiI/YqxD family protein [Phyllobacteriaceae bacterium]